MPPSAACCNILQLLDVMPSATQGLGITLLHCAVHAWLCTVLQGSGSSTEEISTLQSLTDHTSSSAGFSWAVEHFISVNPVYNSIALCSLYDVWSPCPKSCVPSSCVHSLLQTSSLSSILSLSQEIWYQNVFYFGARLGTVCLQRSMTPICQLTSSIPSIFVLKQSPDTDFFPDQYWHEVTLPHPFMFSR